VIHADLIASLTAASFVTDIGHSVREAFYMFWDTLWALVLGFGLSGAVQAFVSREQMQRRLGDHRPASVARASFYGMISSSCSYAASAMAKSLFAKGADFLAAMIFMFASTNLVVELGIVLVVLIGWQFVAAEFIGGAIMTVLLVIAGSLWFRGRALAEAKTAAGDDAEGHEHHHDPEESQLQCQPLSVKLRSKAGWADAASYTMSDLTMLRKEMLVGFLVAGFLAVVVPTHFWNDVFIHGHGFWTSLENVIVGPFVAIISFVCSIGNVPLAAALWKGGISFGGVVSFIFADLITLPLLLIYRKQYGGRMSLRMLAVFWGVMSLAGLITEYLFKAVGWVPSTHPAIVTDDTFRLNSTSVLDVIALVVFTGLYWLYRNRTRLGGGSGYAKDPVCGMQVETSRAPASTTYQGSSVYFCSEHCQTRFEKDPDRYASSRTATPHADGDHDPAAVDPICGMTVDTDSAAARRGHDGGDVYFCGHACAEAFDRRTAASQAVGSSPSEHGSHG
jgi:YHS domain-containing protein/uncharacterized membrane protein YraQ (UPF0718 family)